MEITPLKDSVSVSGRGKVLDVDVSALYSELASNADEGMTIHELRESLGISKAAAYKFVKDAISMGRCKATRKDVVYIDGRRSYVPAYVFGDMA